MNHRVLHVIGSMARGGAETSLVRLCGATKGLDHRVLVLRGGGPLEAELRAVGVPVEGLGGLPGLVAWVRGGEGAGTLLGWMYHGALFATLLRGCCLRASPLVWNIRCSLDAPGVFKPATRLIIRALSALSRWPDRVIYNAHSAQGAHEALGFRSEPGLVVPNGFDLESFRPDPAARDALRAELGLPGDALLVGLVARVHPEKNPGLFLRAMRGQGSAAHVVLVGAGAERGNAWLGDLLTEAGLGGRVHLLGERRDMPRVTAALDVAVSASWNEGFSNALGEALACGVPCVATAVGDSPVLVGEAGRVVPPGDEFAMVEALHAILSLSPGDRAALGALGRARMEAAFGLEAMARRYQSLFACLAGRL